MIVRKNCVLLRASGLDAGRDKVQSAVTDNFLPVPRRLLVLIFLKFSWDTLFWMGKGSSEIS